MKSKSESTEGDNDISLGRWIHCRLLQASVISFHILYLLPENTEKQGSCGKREMTEERKTKNEMGSWETGSLLFGGLLDTGYKMD